MQAPTVCSKHVLRSSLCPRPAHAAAAIRPHVTRNQSLSAVQPAKPVTSCRRGVSLVAKAASEASSEGFEWGANMKSLGISIGAGVLLYLAPTPEGVTAQAWKLLAVFVSTIIGIITQPLPLGAVAMLGLGAAMITKTLTFAQAFSAFSSQIPWLIAIAFWLAGGFIKSGLGNRIAYAIVSAFGKTTLGLTYSLVLAEGLLSPAIPSVAARAGGIFFPLAKALCLACGSDPANGTEKAMGAYLMKVCFQATTVSSAMFITAMAANPLAVNLAADTLGTTISWGTWALAGIVPGLFTLLTMPLLLYLVFPPEIKDTPNAPREAKKQLEVLGPMSTDEKITAGAFLVTVALWIGGASIGINNVAAALVGLSILLVTGVVTWKQCLSNNGAWDTLTWFAALIAMAAHLNKFGFIPWFSEKVVGIVGGLGLPWTGSFAIIAVLYFYSHYMFASGAAHIGAMYTAFLSVAIACGAPSTAAALFLAQISNLMGCLTPYGIGSAPPYFAAGYVSQGDWYKYGFLCSVYYLAVWFTIGGAWWKFIGIM
eukprot:jgi/Ulvmu1/11917/UM081_0077.1